MLRQLGALRDNRLQIAELNVARARKAVEEAVKQIAAARQALVETRGWCQAAYRKANEKLASQPVSSKALYKWKYARNKIREKLDAAEAEVEKAKADHKDKQAKLEEARKKYRESMMAVERLKLLLENAG
jgi:chromosome segregation ATPase